MPQSPGSSTRPSWNSAKRSVLPNLLAVSSVRSAITARPGRRSPFHSKSPAKNLFRLMNTPSSGSRKTNSSSQKDRIPVVRDSGNFPFGAPSNAPTSSQSASIATPSPITKSPCTSITPSLPGFSAVKNTTSFRDSRISPSPLPSEKSSRQRRLSLDFN